MNTSKFAVPTNDDNTINVFLPNSITFMSNASWAMRIIENRIEVNEDMQVTDAAKAVLDALQVYLSTNSITSLKSEPYTTRITINQPGEYNAYVDYTPSFPHINFQRIV